MNLIHGHINQTLVAMVKLVVS